MNDIINRLQTDAANAGQQIQENAANAGNTLNQWRENITNWGSQTTEQVTGFFNDLGNKTNELTQNAGEVLALRSDQDVAAWYNPVSDFQNRLNRLSGAGQELYTELQSKMLPLNALFVDPTRGLPGDGAGRDGIALAVAENFGDLKELGGAGAVPAIGQSFLSNIVEGVKKIGSDVAAVWQDPNRNFVDKIGGTIQTIASGVWNGITGTGNTVNDSVGDVLVERAAKVEQSLLAQGYSPTVATYMRDTILTEAQKAIESGTPLRLDFDNIQQDLQQRQQTQPQQPNVQVAQNPPQQPETPQQPSNTENRNPIVETAQAGLDNVRNFVSSLVNGGQDVNPAQPAAPEATPVNPAIPQSEIRTV